jgi:hypothetical protein
MNRHFFIVLISVIMLVASACNTSKRGTLGKGAGKTDLPRNFDLISELNTRKIDSEFMQGKARVSADIQGDVYNLSAQIKIQRGQLIWISLKKLGLEVARVYITVDSVFALNRFERTYTAESIQSFASQFGFPMDINLIQELLLGNPVVDPKMQWNTNNMGKNLVVKGNEGSISSEIIFSIPLLQMESLQMKDLPNSRELNSKFSQYQIVKDKKYFSYFRVYEFKELMDAPSLVEIQFSEIIFDSPFDAAFEIPARYTRI